VLGPESVEKTENGRDAEGEEEEKKEPAQEDGE
jgi:hypothetical protein